MFFPSVGTRVNDLLGAFGIKGGLVGAGVDTLMGNPIGALVNLRDAYYEAATGRGSSGLERFFTQGGPLPSAMPLSPSAMLPVMGPLCGAGYAGAPQGVDLAQGAPWFSPQRFQASILEQALQQNPMLRASFEHAIGGRIVGFGAADGRMAIQPFAPPGFAMPFAGGFGLSPLANLAGSSLGQMNYGLASTLQMAGALANGAYNAAGSLAAAPFHLASGITSGVSNAAGNLLSNIPLVGGLLGGLVKGVGGVASGALSLTGSAIQGGAAFMGMLAGASFNLASAMFGGPFGFGMLGGGMGPMGSLFASPYGSGFAGLGSANPLAQPGLMQNTSPGAEAQHQAQVSSVLNDPSLTVEDRVMLMLMLICKKMDQDIERQSEYINRVQQQQGSQGQSGMMGAGQGAGLMGGSGIPGAPGQEGAPSIDIETKKLERLVQKRSQMFDMLKGIMEKYDATSKGVIQSLGR